MVLIRTIPHDSELIHVESPFWSSHWGLAPTGQVYSKGGRRETPISDLSYPLAVNLKDYIQGGKVKLLITLVVF